MTSSQGSSSAALRALSSALRSGQLALPLSRLALKRVASSAAEPLIDELVRLSGEGISSGHLALIADARADAIEARLESDAELVWTGPETHIAHSRDTAVVLAELFGMATKSVVVSTFVMHEPRRVFRALADRVSAVPTLEVKLFANVSRGRHDTRHESEILREFSVDLRKEWPGDVRPWLYYDPRSLVLQPDERATWHAKVVVIDETIAFVTSANFTEWAQERNVEAGVVVRNESFARQLSKQFDALIRSRAVLEVPGFR